MLGGIGKELCVCVTKFLAKELKKGRVAVLSVHVFIIRERKIGGFGRSIAEEKSERVEYRKVWKSVGITKNIYMRRCVLLFCIIA